MVYALPLWSRTEFWTSVGLLCLAMSELYGTSSAKIPTPCRREADLVAASEVSLSSELWLKAFTGHSLLWLKVESFANLIYFILLPLVVTYSTCITSQKTPSQLAREAMSHYSTWRQCRVMWTSSRCCLVPRPPWMPRKASSAGGPSWDGIVFLKRCLEKYDTEKQYSKVASRSILQYHVFERVACSVVQFDFCIQ